MRFDHYHGLNRWGRRCVERKLDAVEEGTITFASGKVVPFRRQASAVESIEVIGHIAGAYKDTVAPLHAYKLRSGRVLEEFVQDTIHCGGPNYYIALRYRGGRKLKSSLWTKKEMDAA